MLCQFQSKINKKTKLKNNKLRQILILFQKKALNNQKVKNY